MNRMGIVFGLCLMLIPAAGRMQASPAGVLTVIVLDFENRSGVGGDSLARNATDAVAVGLAESGRFEVLKREEVSRAARELGPIPPLDQIARSRLAAALDAQVVVDGAITFVREVKRTERRFVRVGLRVWVRDAASGEVISGAAVVGEAPARGDTISSGICAIHLAVAAGTAHSSSTGPGFALASGSGVPGRRNR